MLSNFWSLLLNWDAVTALAAVATLLFLIYVRVRDKPSGECIIKANLIGKTTASMMSRRGKSIADAIIEVVKDNESAIVDSVETVFPRLLKSDTISTWNGHVWWLFTFTNAEGGRMHYVRIPILKFELVLNDENLVRISVISNFSGSNEVQKDLKQIYKGRNVEDRIVELTEVDYNEAEKYNMTPIFSKIINS